MYNGQNIGKQFAMFSIVRGMFMDEYVIKQKIQRACFEPRAPEGLIRKVVLRAQAAGTLMQAQKQMESSLAANSGEHKKKEFAL